MNHVTVITLPMKLKKIAKWHAVVHLVEALLDKPEGSRVRFPMGLSNFSLKILPASLWPRD